MCLTRTQHRTNYTVAAVARACCTLANQIKKEKRNGMSSIFSFTYLIIYTYIHIYTYKDAYAHISLWSVVLVVLLV